MPRLSAFAGAQFSQLSEQRSRRRRARLGKQRIEQIAQHDDGRAERDDAEIEHTAFPHQRAGGRIEVDRLDDLEIIEAPITEAAMPSAASSVRCAATAASNTRNLAQKPKSGGMPARLNMKIAKAAARPGWLCESPARLGGCSRPDCRPSSFICSVQAKATNGHHDIDGEIAQHRGHALFRARGEAR